MLVRSDADEHRDLVTLLGALDLGEAPEPALSDMSDAARDVNATEATTQERGDNLNGRGRA
jgi:hypothetical protein